MKAVQDYLLIGRIDGRSTSRRQRRCSQAADAMRLVARWTEKGFNGFWLFGPFDAAGQRSQVATWTVAPKAEQETDHA